jgi:hypothetical protein
MHAFTFVWILQVLIGAEGVESSCEPVLTLGLGCTIHGRRTKDSHLSIA